MSILRTVDPNLTVAVQAPDWSEAIAAELVVVSWLPVDPEVIVNRGPVLVINGHGEGIE